MSLPAHIDGAGDGECLAFDGKVYLLVCEKAFAPGAPVGFAVRLGEAEVRLAGKSIGSKRRADGRFDVRARPVNLRREDREAVQAALAPAAGQPL